MINIVEENIQGVNPLDQSLLLMGKGLCREHPGNWVKGAPGNLSLPLPDHSKACALLQHPIIDTLPLQIELFHGKASLFYGSVHLNNVSQLP